LLWETADGATIGGNHLIHACRRNIDVTAIVCNNYNYGMTGGQYFWNNARRFLTTTSRTVISKHGFDRGALATASGAPFVARTISENVLQNAD
jgi:2-oxoglutarate ferredoxin oxidoreductase subunit beta